MESYSSLNILHFKLLTTIPSLEHELVLVYHKQMSLYTTPRVILS